jgi:hypothetical protein
MTPKATRYWTTKKSKAVVEERRAELDFLIDFANADMTSEASRHIQTRILDYLHRHPALHPENRDWKTDGNPPNIMDALQRHLHSQLGKVIENKKMLWEMPLWEVSGSVLLKLHPIKNRFYERFQLRKVKRGNETNALKKIMDLWLIEIIRDLDFSPQRFGQCPRCGGFFYNPTERVRTYCSTRCANAVRQQQFRDGRRGKGD